LLFNEGTGTAAANTGASSSNWPAATLVQVSGSPGWSSNAPPGYASNRSVDFGTAVGNKAVDLGGQMSQLKNLTSFTITGWLNCRSSTEGSGGNRIVSWINNGGNGVDLVYKSDGSLQIGIDQWPDGSPAFSAAGRVPTDAGAGAGNWRFFAVTYDSTLGSAHVKWYFGSASAAASLSDEDTYARGAVDPNIGPNCTIGHFNTATRAGATDRMFRGLMDDIRIFGATSGAAGALALNQIEAVRLLMPAGGDDADGDGLPDSWERTHFGGTAVSAGSPGQDQDHDGFDDWAEYVAGTQPTNGASRLEISGVGHLAESSNLIIHWQSVAGRSYSVLRGTNLAGVGWSALASNIAASPPLNTRTVNVSGAKSGFYRVKARR
jgi:hypothetical protein